MEEVTKVLPAIALRGTTILPDMIVHFDISRPKSVRAVEEAMLGDQKIFLITQKDPDTEVPGLLDVYKIGTIAVIKQVVRMPKDVLRILVEAESVHPSPLSAYNGFFGCKHFSKCNAFLEAHGIDPIDWDLTH